MLNRQEHAESVREFYRGQGAVRERLRIIELLNNLPFIWMGDVQLIQTNRQEIIDLIYSEVECHCDPCGDKACDCYGVRCGFCKELFQ